MQVQVLYCIH